jgi:hypothetical protein
MGPAVRVRPGPNFWEETQAWNLAIKLLVGLVLMGISVAYLYRPTLVLRVNAWGRTMLVFNDAHLLHFRRRWGLAGFFGAILFLYSGFLNLSKSIPLEPVRDPLEAGYLAFYEKI